MPENPIPVLLALLLPIGLFLVLVTGRPLPPPSPLEHPPVSERRALPARTSGPARVRITQHPPSSMGPLYVAGGLLGNSETSEELRGAIANAVAIAAPVPQAAAFLEQHGSPELGAATRLLGSRPTGTDTLHGRYFDLLFERDADVSLRVRLVAGLVDLPGEELLTIALEDPHARVRAQAWMSLSLSASFPCTPAMLALLRQAFELRESEDRGIAGHAALHALAWLIPRAQEEQAELLPDLRALVQTIADAPDTDKRDRDCALRILETSGPHPFAASDPDCPLPATPRSEPRSAE